ncbi:MAG: hypothetical protein HQL30_00035 [Candidatus Omnitrophica bacterium]|nr:hypothetical protein [Candidatus Omnitrophota bacterium]
MGRLLIPIVFVTLLINSSLTHIFAVSDGVYVIDFKGDVKVVRQGTNTGVQCFNNMGVDPGDIIHTGPGSSATIGYVSRSSFNAKISENTLVQIRDGQPFWMELSTGGLLTRLGNLQPGEQFMIKTPVGACGARGTGWYMTTNGHEDHITAFEHNVYYRPLDQYGDLSENEIWINEGYARKAVKYEEPGQMTAADPGFLDYLWKEAHTMAEIGSAHTGIIEKKNIGTNGTI